MPERGGEEGGKAERGGKEDRVGVAAAFWRTEGKGRQTSGIDFCEDGRTDGRGRPCPADGQSATAMPLFTKEEKSVERDEIFRIRMQKFNSMAVQPRVLKEQGALNYPVQT